MIRTCQVITSINVDTGGPAVSVTRLAQELTTTGFESHLLTLNYTRLGPQLHPKNATVHSIEAGSWTKILRGRNAQIYATLQRLALDLDCIHNHGLWMFPNWYASRVARQFNLPLIISPRGMLDEWSMHRRRLRKYLAWHLFEKRSMQTAGLIHATSADEEASIRKLGFTQPIAVIPNGVDIPNDSSAEGQPTLNELLPQFVGKKCILFLSRIHPKKGLRALVKSWSKLSSDHSDWHLIISGPDAEGHRNEIETLITQLGLQETVTFTGPVSGHMKSALLFGCEMMVLPTHSENFGIVVAEALAHGLPVITTHAAPWRELDTERCGWWIEDDESALTDALKKAIHTPESERQSMGKRGRDLVQRRYSWHTVGQQMHDAYIWLLNNRRESPPSCIH